MGAACRFIVGTLQRTFPLQQISRRSDGQKTPRLRVQNLVGKWVRACQRLCYWPIWLAGQLGKESKYAIKRRQYEMSGRPLSETLEISIVVHGDMTLI